MKYPQFCYPCTLPFIITQKWGENATYYSQLGMKGHNGWDFGIPIGTPIYACHDGIVFFVGTDGSGAKEITIDTMDRTYRTYYAHLSEFKVQANDIVKKGQLIGLSGNTGRYTTGPHLHFGVHPVANFQDTEHNNGYGGAIDPIHFFDGTYPVVPSTKPEHFINFQKALEEFQKAEGLKPYPLVGPGTRKALNKYLTNEKYN